MYPIFDIDFIYLYAYIVYLIRTNNVCSYSYVGLRIIELADIYMCYLAIVIQIYITDIGWGKKVNVSLVREPTTSFGVCIVGGKVFEEKKHTRLLYVSVC